jgi:hypothetical protein
MRLCSVGVAALLALWTSSSSAQNPSHEYRPQLQVLSPYWHDVALTLVAEERVATNEFGHKEIHQAIGLAARPIGNTSAALELRQVRQANGTIEHHWIPTLTVAVPVGLGFELQERVRVDLRDVAGSWSRRWQSRARLQHPVAFADRTFTPFLFHDLSYDTRYGALTRRQVAAGVRIPLAHGTSMDPYLMRQTDDRRVPVELIVAGMILRVAL